MAKRASVWTLAGLCAAALTLAACDENEQGRILRYEKGTYLGPPDAPLDEATREELRFRAKQQAGS